MTEATVICTPAMNPGNHLDLLRLPSYTKSKLTGPALHFYTSYRAKFNVACVSVQCSAPLWRHFHLLRVSTLLYRFFSLVCHMSVLIIQTILHVHIE